MRLAVEYGQHDWQCRMQWRAVVVVLEVAVAITVVSQYCCYRSVADSTHASMERRILKGAVA